MVRALWLRGDNQDARLNDTLQHVCIATFIFRGEAEEEEEKTNQHTGGKIFILRRAART